jgi:carboxyl-terminal processing protease
MAIMLQNSHFARLPFNEELSKRFLDDYLKSLDFQRLYFTQQDVDRFSAEYGERLHTLLLQGTAWRPPPTSTGPLNNGSRTRVAQAELCSRRTSISPPMRNGADEPQERALAEKRGRRRDLWRLQIKEAVLAESLRREMLSKLATEQGKPDPGSDDRSPKEKVSLRYKRFLSSVKDVDEEEIANYFLSAVARSYDPHTDYMSSAR